jgi:hypothetical protein
MSSRCSLPFVPILSLGAQLAAALACVGAFGCPGARTDGMVPASDRPATHLAWQQPRKENLEEPQTIGAATMTVEGTLELMLRATDGHGMVGDAFLRVPPGDKDYEMWLKHLGGMKPGESKFILPFPETK